MEIVMDGNGLPAATLKTARAGRRALVNMATEDVMGIRLFIVTCRGQLSSIGCFDSMTAERTTMEISW